MVACNHEFQWIANSGEVMSNYCFDVHLEFQECVIISAASFGERFGRTKWVIKKLMIKTNRYKNLFVRVVYLINQPIDRRNNCSQCVNTESLFSLLHVNTSILPRPSRSARLSYGRSRN